MTWGIGISVYVLLGSICAATGIKTLLRNEEYTAHEVILVPIFAGLIWPLFLLAFGYLVLIEKIEETRKAVQ